MKREIDRLVKWLREKLTASGTTGFVVGLSGGLDSAVVVRLCHLASTEGTLAVLLPCHSDPHDEADARLVADHFKIRTTRVDLASTYDGMLQELQKATVSLTTGAPHTPDDIRARLPVANIKPRLRMTTLYFIANSLNRLVVGTGNRSELTIGYFTKYGDGGVDLLPIGHLVKTQVRAMARQLGIPASIIDKAPSAGLWIGQTDEGEMGFSYDELDRYITEGPQSVAPAVAMKIERLARAAEHKKTPTPVPEAGKRQPEA